MTTPSLYKDTLLDHHRSPRNRSTSPIEGADSVCRGTNPSCGDEVEVGIYLQSGYIQRVKFRARGCAICVASASMMTEAVTGLKVGDIQPLCDHVHARFHVDEQVSDSPLPGDLSALDAVRQHRSRKKCVLLSWDALTEALAEAAAKKGGDDCSDSKHSEHAV